MVANRFYSCNRDIKRGREADPRY